MCPKTIKIEQDLHVVWIGIDCTTNESQQVSKVIFPLLCVCMCADEASLSQVFVFMCGKFPLVMHEVLTGCRRCELPNITNSGQTDCIIQGCVARGLCMSTFCYSLFYAWVWSKHNTYFGPFSCAAAVSHKAAVSWICWFPVLLWLTHILTYFPTCQQYRSSCSPQWGGFSLLWD